MTYKKRIVATILFAASLAAIAGEQAQGQASADAQIKASENLPAGVVALTPAEIPWSKTGALASKGLEQANIIGAPDKDGPYTIRLKFPAGYKLEPHVHRDARHITILSGVWYTGYGNVFDESKLKALPAGSIYTEPAGLPHFVVTKGPVEIQVTGTGPSSRVYVDEHGQHKH